MAKRKIRIDPLDPDSIEDGLALLKMYRRMENEAIYKTLPQKLCEMACEAARRAYEGEPVTVDWRLKEVHDDGVSYSITAEDDEVCFIEFGAGIGALGKKGFSADQGFAGMASESLGIYIAPGSWSVLAPEGKMHFLETDRADEYGYPKGPIPLEEWKYNREARMGLWRAYTEILASFDEVGKEVFLDTNWGE